MYRKASTTTKSDVRFLTHAGIPRTEGFAHGGVRRSTVSFDTDTHRKLLRNGREMPAASFFRRCWHPMVLQTTCSAFGARGLQTFMAIGAPYAPWPIVSLSYRTKAHDLTLSLPAHPIIWHTLFRTSNSDGVLRKRSTWSVGPSDASSVERATLLASDGHCDQVFC